MPPPQQQQQGSSDNSLGPVWVIAGLFLAVWAIWFFFHAQISYGVVRLRFHEGIFIRYFTHSIDPLLTKIMSLPPDAYGTLSPTSLFNLSTLVGNYFKYPVAIGLFILGIVSYFKNPQVKFRKTYTMESLLKVHIIDWPQTTPVVNLNLVTTKLDEGPWASSQAPLQFSRIHGLFTEVRAESVEPTLKHRARYS